MYKHIKEEGLFVLCISIWMIIIAGKLFALQAARTWLFPSIVMELGGFSVRLDLN